MDLLHEEMDMNINQNSNDFEFDELIKIKIFHNNQNVKWLKIDGNKRYNYMYIYIVKYLKRNECHSVYEYFSKMFNEKSIQFNYVKQYNCNEKCCLISYYIISQILYYITYYLTL